MDNSLPYPDFFIPPNGRRGSDLTKSFTKHSPASNLFLAISSPLRIFFVKTAAPKPNGELFAKSIASFSLLALITEKTGPRISLHQMLTYLAQRLKVG